MVNLQPGSSPLVIDQGQAPEALLDTYQAERLPVMRNILLQKTEAITDLAMSSTSPRPEAAPQSGPASRAVRAGAASDSIPGQPDRDWLSTQPPLRQPRAGRQTTRRRPRARRARPVPGGPRRGLAGRIAVRCPRPEPLHAAGRPSGGLRHSRRGLCAEAAQARGRSFASFPGRAAPRTSAARAVRGELRRSPGVLLVRPDGYVGFAGGKRASAEHLDAYCRRWLTAREAAGAPEREAA